MDRTWHLYILRTDRNALYTGIATDVSRRVKAHSLHHKSAARFTRACRSVTLVYACPIGSRGLALRAEAAVKRLTKEKKERIVSDNPGAPDLLRRLRLTPDAPEPDLPPQPL